MVQELLVNKKLNLGKMHQGKKRVKKDAPDETLSDRFKYFNWKYKDTKKKLTTENH